jgi:hypothetical protein
MLQLGHNWILSSDTNPIAPCGTYRTRRTAKLDSGERAEGYVNFHAKRDKSGPDNGALSLLGRVAGSPPIRLLHTLLGYGKL